MRHVVRTQQLSPELLKILFKRADELEKIIGSPRKYQILGTTLGDRTMFNVFFEPSTRTRISFSAAAQHLGMQVITTENGRVSSSDAKGESLEDTIKVLCEYSPNVIVVRHYEEKSGERAAKVSSVPIINAGDGAGQHPTQAILDMYTIHKELGRTNKLNVVIGGDLKHARTSRSLAYLLAKYPDNHITFVSPPHLRMGKDILSYLKRNNTEFTQTEDHKAAFKKADVVYWPRIQKERFESNDKLDYDFSITPKEMKLLKKKSILMSPLPRLSEIDHEVDKDPRAVYFRQAGNGMLTRMALLEWVMGVI